MIKLKDILTEISAIGGLKQVVKGNTDRVEGIKVSKEMAQAMIGLTLHLMVENIQMLKKVDYIYQ